MTYGLTVTNPRIFKFGNSILFNTLTEAPSSGGGGSTGSSGNQGPQGIYGPTGTIGSQGFQGFIGITGPRGFQGPVSTGSSLWITSGTSIYYNTGNVGIGTTSPSSPLHVTATSNTSPANNAIYVYNPTNSANNHAIMNMRVAGTSAGNPYVSWDVNGTTGWSLGIDNSDSQKLKISNAWDSLTTQTKLTIQTNGNVGIGTIAPTSKLEVYNGAVTSTSSTQDVSIAINPGNGNFGTIEAFNISNSSKKSLCLNPYGGNIGIGSTNPSGALHIDSSTQLRPRINLTGQEFYQAANTSTEGVSMLLGVNRTNNRQLWIADSSKLAQNTSNPACRIIVGTSDSTIDCAGTIGNVNLPIQFGSTNALTTIAGSGIYMNGKVGIGTTTPQGLLSVNLANSTNNSIPGGINAWDSTYSIFGPGAGNINGGGLGLGWNSNLGGILTCIQPNVSWNTMNYQAAAHRFYVMGASFTGPSMVITPTGRIGIGTGSVDYTLHVSSNEQNPFGVTSTTTTAYPNISFLFPNLTTSCYFNLGQGGSNNNMAFGWNVVGGVGATTNYLSFTINAIGDVFRAYSNNTNTNIQLNKYTTNGTLQTINSNGTLSASSDIRLKNSIESLTGTYMDKVMGLNPVSFKYNEDQYNTHLGFIAQDVEKVLPLAVDGKKHDYDFLRDERGDLILDADGNPQEDPEKKTPRYRGLNTTAIVAVLTKGIQEQQSTIESQQQTITHLQSTIDTQQSTLATQQQTINDLLARVIALENKNI